MSEINHTPLPWRRIAQGGSSTIVSADKPSRNDTRIPSYGYRDEDHCIAYPFIEDDGVRSRWDFVCFSHEDSAFIVEACNSYYEMRTALAAKNAEIEALRSELTKAKAALHEVRIEAYQREPVPKPDAVKNSIRGSALALSGRLGGIEQMCRSALKGDAQ